MLHIRSTRNEFTAIIERNGERFVACLRRFRAPTARGPARNSAVEAGARRSNESSTTAAKTGWAVRILITIFSFRAFTG
jgi:hypothetical protein